MQSAINQMSQYWRCDIQCDRCNQPCCVLYVKVVDRVKPGSSHHMEKYFFLFLQLCVCTRQ